MKTRLVPQIYRDAMTSTWLGGSCDLRETLIGGRLHCANISPAVPRPSAGHKNPISGEIFDLFYVICVRYLPAYRKIQYLIY